MSNLRRTIALYGHSGSTKSSQCYNLAKWYIEKYQKKVRYVNADNGEGIKYMIDSGLEESGWVDTLDLSQRAGSAMSDLMKVVEGYWPRKGAFTKDAANAWRDKDNVGMYIFEGGTSIADLIRRGIASSDTKKAFNTAYSYQEEGYNFGGIAMQHIGMIQDIMMRAIVNVKKLPLDFVIWTFHACKAEEKISKATMIGPMIIGDALTTKLPREFGSVFHLQKSVVTVEHPDGTASEEMRAFAYLEEHQDEETGIRCTAKVTILPELVPLWKKKYPDGRALLSYERGLAEVMDVMLKVQTASKVVGDKFISGLKMEDGGGVNGRDVAGSSVSHERDGSVTSDSSDQTSSDGDLVAGSGLQGTEEPSPSDTADEFEF